MSATVTQDALIKRINRKLTPTGEALRITRGRAWNSDLGDFYIVDLHTRGLVAGHQDLEKLGRELGVLRPGEKLAEVGS